MSYSLYIVYYGFILFKQYIFYFMIAILLSHILELEIPLFVTSLTLVVGHFLICCNFLLGVYLSESCFFEEILCSLSWTVSSEWFYIRCCHVPLRHHPLEPTFYLHFSVYNFPHHVININPSPQTSSGFKFSWETFIFTQSCSKDGLPSAGEDF